MARQAELEDVLREHVVPAHCVDGVFIKFQTDAKDRMERCTQDAIEQYFELMHATMTQFPGPAPPTSLLKAAWRRIAPCCVADKLVEWFAAEEAEKFHIMWSFVWRDFCHYHDKGSRSVKIARMRLAIQDALEKHGITTPPEEDLPSEDGIGDWLMDDDLTQDSIKVPDPAMAADVVSIGSSTQRSLDEYPVEPAVVNALLDMPGSIPDPAAHRDCCRTPKAKKKEKADTSTKETKKTSGAHAGTKKTVATKQEPPKSKMGGKVGDKATTIVKKMEKGCEFYQLRQHGKALVQLTLKMMPDPACNEAMRDLQRMAEDGATKAELSEAKQGLIKRWRDAH